MGQRLAFAVAAGLAAFVAVLLGALGAYMLVHGSRSGIALAAPNDGTDTATAPLQAPPAPQFDSPGSSGQQQGTDGGGPSTTDGYTISADDAARIALNSAPGSSLLQQPRLVSLRGTTAYEVALDKGYVYVDANSGQVLINGANGSTRQRRRPGTQQAP